MPTKGMGFFPFEEDLPHHVRQSMVIVASGVSFSFFANPYLHDYLKGLQARHRPAYHQKLVKLVRCVSDTLTEEVRSLVFFLYLDRILIILTLYFVLINRSICWK